MEEEIDLREYIEVILKHWRLIIGLSLLTAIIAFLVNSFLPPVYEAEAKMIILKSSIDISFEPSIRDSNQEGNNIGNDRQTLLNLVKSVDVATAVLEKAGALLKPEGQNVLKLLNKVNTANDGNIITINVRDQNPEIAAQLADIWAQAYESYVNQLFNGRSIVLLEEVRAQSEEVEATYRLAQANLENFLKNSPIALLARDIKCLEQKLDTKYDLLARQYEVTHNLLASKYSELNRIESWLDDAETVQDQLTNTTASSAGASMGDFLALMLLRERSSAGSIPVQLQVNLSEIDGDIVTPDDAANMIVVIKAHKARIEADIETLSAELLQGDDQVEQSARTNELAKTIKPLIDQKLVLEEALEIQSSKERELTTARDLAWENDRAVQRKLAEIELDSQITDFEVRVAARAIIPDPNNPVSPKRLLNTVIGGALGFMIALMAVFVIEYWQNNSQVSAETKGGQQDNLGSTS